MVSNDFFWKLDKKQHLKFQTKMKRNLIFFYSFMVTKLLFTI